VSVTQESKKFDRARQSEKTRENAHLAFHQLALEIHWIKLKKHLRYREVLSESLDYSGNVNRLPKVGTQNCQSKFALGDPDSSPSRLSLEVL
jgi:hypothetical protein